MSNDIYLLNNNKNFNHLELRRNQLFSKLSNIVYAALYIFIGILSLLVYANIDKLFIEIKPYKNYFLLPSLLLVLGIISLVINIKSYRKLKNKII